MIIRLQRGKWFALVLLLGMIVAPQAEGAAPVHPIVDLTMHCLLGASRNGQWLDAAHTAPLLTGGERYRLYALTGYRGLGTGSRPESIGDPCPDVQDVTISPAATVNRSVLAVASSWPALPRLPHLQTTNQAVYRQAVAVALRDKGLTVAAAAVRLTQVLRVDLDGDGQREVLISATNISDPPQPSTAAGSYSIVLLRQVVGGQVHTSVLAAEVYPQAVAFGAITLHKVSAVLDLNGDGVLEIVLYHAYYEGAWSSVDQVKGTTVQEVLSCGCGV